MNIDKIVKECPRAWAECYDWIWKRYLGHVPKEEDESKLFFHEMTNRLCFTPYHSCSIILELDVKVLLDYFDSVGIVMDFECDALGRNKDGIYTFWYGIINVILADDEERVAGNAQFIDIFDREEIEINGLYKEQLSRTTAVIYGIEKAFEIREKQIGDEE